MAYDPNLSIVHCEYLGSRLYFGFCIGSPRAYLKQKWYVTRCRCLGSTNSESNRRHAVKRSKHG